MQRNTGWDVIWELPPDPRHAATCCSRRQTQVVLQSTAVGGNLCLEVTDSRREATVFIPLAYDDVADLAAAILRHLSFMAGAAG